MPSENDFHILAEESKVSDLPTHERDLYADILRATARASARGVEPENVMSMIIAVLVKEAAAHGYKDPANLAEGVRIAAVHHLGGLE